MKCAVKNCNSYNYKKASECSTFRFPSDIALQKQWISSCQRQEKFNPKTSYICMMHFKAEDFENTLQFDMGLATKRILKRGTVPTISCRSMENSKMQEERAERIQKRENKKIVNELLLNYGSSTVAVKDNDESSLDKENANPLNADENVNREGNEMNSSHLLMEHFERNANCSNVEDLSLGNQFDSLPDASHTNDYISSLRSQMFRLRSYLLGRNDGMISDAANIEVDDTPDLDRSEKSLTGVLFAKIDAKIEVEEDAFDQNDLENMAYDGLENLAGYICHKLKYQVSDIAVPNNSQDLQMHTWVNHLSEGGIASQRKK